MSTDKEDFKLVIFGWIVTVLGIPKEGKPDKYNELTDKIYDLVISHDAALKQKLMEALPDDYSGWTNYGKQALPDRQKAYNQALNEVRETIQSIFKLDT